MSGVLLGFGIVLVLAGIGAGAAALLPGRAPEMERGLQPAIYYVTNPALMLVLISDADLVAIAGVFTPIALLTAAVTGGSYALVSRLVLRRPAAPTAGGAMASSYVNAGNIGVPIAIYAVGSTDPVVAVLLAQLLVIAPVYLTLFAWCGPDSGPTAGAPTWGTVLRSLANPVTIATAAGALLSLSGLSLPAVLWTPVEMLGHASVPLLLLVFGMSLVGQKPLGDREMRVDVLLATAVKLTVMPVAAWALARFLFGVDGTELFGVVVMAALPSAQNVFLFATRFHLRPSLARDVVFLSSLLSMPAVLAVALALG
ncbi:AEC family transporter [Brachybacterium sacelli]|uniref:Permease n=1 Tax=Brachybacterium sacelli TaxID=173364 RepID=A0ABS4X7G6_9MICO|nr:putative permease [Brachybacterium sacelli]